METPAANTPTPLKAEPASHMLDPWAEWHDHANQWDVSEIWHAPKATPHADYDETGQTPAAQAE